MEENISLLLKENNIEYTRQKTFKWLKRKKYLYLDFYLEKYNIGIEVQGEQHFTPIKKFGGESFLKEQQERDTIKKRLCDEHGIKLFYITKKIFDR